MAKGATIHGVPLECNPLDVHVIDYAEAELTILIGVHLGLAQVCADLGVDAPPGSLTTGAMARRVLGNLMDAGWTPPEVTK